MRNILTEEFICSEKNLKSFRESLSNSIPNPFDQNNLKRYKVEITVIEEDYDRTEIDNLELVKNILLKNIETFSKGKLSGYFDAFFAEHFYKKRDLSNLKYFLVRTKPNLFNRRTLYTFLKEQDISIYKDYLIPGSSVNGDLNILIFIKDQDTYNQIKLAFSNDTKISTLWELGI